MIQDLIGKILATIFLLSGTWYVIWLMWSN